LSQKRSKPKNSELELGQLFSPGHSGALRAAPKSVLSQNPREPAPLSHLLILILIHLTWPICPSSNLSIDAALIVFFFAGRQSTQS